MSDVSSVTKYFPTINEGFIATTTAQVNAGATSVPLSTVSGLTNGSVFVGIIEPGDATKQQVFTGTVNTAGLQITNVVWTRGTNVAHSSGVSVVDYTTGTDINMIVAGVLKQHNQDGTHGAITGSSLALTGNFSQSAGSFSIPAASLSTAALNPNSPGWATFTPTFVNMTLGNGTLIARYGQIGKTVHFFVKVIYGTTSTITGIVSFSTPVVPRSDYYQVDSGEGTLIGNTVFLDANTSRYFGMTSFVNGGNGILPSTIGVAASLAQNGGGINATVPFTWGPGDSWVCTGTYEAA